MRSIGRTTVWLAAVLLLASGATAQVVRESDASSIAGSLGGLDAKSFDDFEFSSVGGEVLFATVDAAIYQAQGAAEHEEHTVAVEEEPGGCGDDSGVGICLQVVDSSDGVVCWATRPRAPGWQRDPRLVCLLPTVSGRPAEYRLRVALADHDCGDLLYPAPGAGDDVPYLLNVSLRRVAPQGPMAPAIAVSRNRF